MNVTLLSENIIRYCNNNALICIGVTYVVLKEVEKQCPNNSCDENIT